MTFEWFAQWNIALNPLEYCTWAIPWESGQEGLKKILGHKVRNRFFTFNCKVSSLYQTVKMYL